MLVKKKNLLVFIFIILNGVTYADNIKQVPFIDSLYREDQFYTKVIYTSINETLENQDRAFYYGFSGGILRDMPINKNRNMALALGLGYNFSKFHLPFEESEQNYLANKTIGFLEVPFEFRFRTSTATSYKFWRAYLGFILQHKIHSNTKYDKDPTQNTPSFYINKNLYFLTFSVGYSNWNFQLLYPISSLFKYDVSSYYLKSQPLMLGLIFYIL